MASETGERSHHRGDVQGLRALAVLAVVVFHAGLPLPGGFLGVDVFFVISGYVITLVLLREWEATGKISLLAFSWRRVRRLAPVGALVSTVTVIAAAPLLSPLGPAETTALTGLGSAFLVANVVIAKTTGDYFAPSADSNALLHLWSLSVEEQFYLVFPLVLLGALVLGSRLRARPRLLASGVVAAVSLVSLAAQPLLAPLLPSGTWLLGFYSPIPRAWEFGAGALVALLPPLAERLPRVVRALGSVLALGVIVAWFALTNGTVPFPGEVVPIPMAATAALIALGPATPVARMLATRPLTYIGDRSYSWYLWHWPAVVLGTAMWPNAATPVLAGSFALILAAWTYRVIEKPTRRGQWRGTQLTPARLLPVLALAPLVALGSWAVSDRLILPAYESGVVAQTHPGPTSPQNPVVGSEPCPYPEIRASIGGLGHCVVSDPDRPTRVVLLGDSHAEMLYRGFSAHVADSSVGVYSFRAPRMFGSPARLDAVTDAIATDSETKVVIVARNWRRTGLSVDDQNDLDRAVARLRRAGLTVLISDDVPSYRFDSTQCQYRIAPAIPTTRCTRSAAGWWREYGHYRGQLQVVSARREAPILSMADLVCTEQTCSMLADGELAYSDRNHLNATGSTIVVGRLIRTDPALRRSFEDAGIHTR